MLDGALWSGHAPVLSRLCNCGAAADKGDASELRSPAAYKTKPALPPSPNESSPLCAGTTLLQQCSSSGFSFVIAVFVFGKEEEEEASMAHRPYMQGQLS